MVVDSNVLVVAFDGLDHDLIERFDCQNLQQTEFGRIDNRSAVNKVVTSELFASFLTGEHADVHGVSGLRRWPATRKGRLLAWTDTYLPGPVHGGIRRILNGQQRTYYRADLTNETFLDHVDDARTIRFPSYDKQTLHDRIWTGLSLYDDAELCNDDSLAEFHYRRHELFRNLQYPFEVLLCHFIRSDTIQHIHEEEAKDSPEVLKPYYAMFDDLAGEIIEAAEEYDYVFFLSDHGLPEGDEHNENAFYSVNEPLGLDEPRLTDFHDLFLELLNVDQ